MRGILLSAMVGSLLAGEVAAVDWAALSAGDLDVAADLEQALAEQGSVDLPQGRFRLSRTVVVDLSRSRFVSLTGDGTARLLMEGAGPALRFVGSHEGTAAPKTVRDEIWEAERTPSVRGIEIVGRHPEADGLEASGTMQLTLHHLVVRQCRHAVHLTNRNRNVLISDCHLYENTGVGIYYDEVDLHQSNVIGCHISYNGGGGIVSRGGNVRNVHIGTCDIEGNHSENGAATANVLLDSTGGSIGEVAITGCTIQHTRKAPDSANIRIIGRGTDAGVAKRSGIAHTQEGNVTITGNVFSDVQINVDIEQARGVVISGNTFWEGIQHDLRVRDSSHIVVNGNNFDANPRYVVNGTGGTERNGVRFERTVESSFTANVTSGVRQHEAAIDFLDCGRLQLSNNTVCDSDGALLRLKNCWQCIVTGNLLSHTKGDQQAETALQVEGGTDNMVEGNLKVPAKP